jgi:hypothetical protein
MVAIAEIAPATIAAIDETRMSRLEMCANREPARQQARDLLELGDLASLERPGPAGLQRELVGEPVAGDVHQHGKRDEQPECASADRAADRDQQCGQAGDQQPGSNLGSETSRCDVHGLESPFD